VFVQSGAPPEEAAFVGSELTPLVTTLGSLDAKQLATSPAWARRLTIELAQAGVGRRSVVAAAFSGSFPALNVAVVCAAQALEADVLAVSSVTASAWGATDPGFTWPEIEARLVASRLMAPASVAISVGGDGDTGQDLEPDGRTLAEGIAARTAAALGATALAPSSLAEAVRQRLAILDRRASGRRIAAFVNVGGTSASLGRDVAVLRLQSGWIDRHARVDAGDGLLAHYARRGVPVLHLLNIRDLAIRWQIAARTHLEDRQQ
jgi:poly-gamma-glutamate system protein